MTGAPLYARWTTEQHNKLCALIDEGKSMGQVAAELGKPRGSISGRMGRNKIKSQNASGGRVNGGGIVAGISAKRSHKKLNGEERKAIGSSAGGRTASLNAKRQKNDIPIEPHVTSAGLAEFNAVIPKAQLVTVIGFENNSCRWPINDGPDYLFCGSPDADMSRKVPYCGYHSRIAGAGYTRERGYGFKRSVNTYR